MIDWNKAIDYATCLRKAAELEKELLGNLLSEGDLFTEALLGRADRIEQAWLTLVKEKEKEKNDASR